MRARESALEYSAIDASHVAFENRQVVGDVKEIPQSVITSRVALLPVSASAVNRNVSSPPFYA